MKKLFLLISMLFFVASLSQAQEKQEVTTNGAEIQFDKTVHDYGQVPYNGDGTCEFKFTNTGNEPLILQKPRSSCGCTVPTWPKEPILPGESDVIKVTYQTTKVGVISKSITVTSNAKKNSSVVLRIKGKVLEKPTETLPEKESSLGTPLNNTNR